MNKLTKQKLAKLEASQCQVYGVDAMAEHFTVEPAAAQRIISKVQHSVAFLMMINMVMVEQTNGETLSLGVNDMIAGRTDTDTNDRSPNKVHSLAKTTYACQFTEFDTKISYAELDAWAHKPMFNALITSKTATAAGLSMLSVGWNGTSIAKPTNPTTSPLGQDVNKGWLKHLLDINPGNYLNSAVITISDANNLDVLVVQAISALGEVQQNDPALVAIIGHELLADSKSRLYAANAETPSEKQKVELAQVVDTYGGLPSYKVPFFPARGILVTTLANLSIYVHNSMRRQQIDNPKRSQLETYSSKSIDYVLEDYELAAYIDRIALPA